MAGFNRLVPLVAVALSTVSASAFADGLDSSALRLDMSDGFLSRPVGGSDPLAVTSGAPNASPSTALGLSPSRSLAFDVDWGGGIRSELRSDFVDGGDLTRSVGHQATTPSQLSLLGNVIYDFTIPDTSLGAHVGAGVGLDNTRLGFGPAGDLLAYQFLAGTDITLLPELRLGAEYRFLGTADLTGASLPFPHYNPGGHSLLLTLRYDWGARDNVRPGTAAPAPTVAAAAALPVPAAAAPADSRHGFEVVFDLDKADLAVAAAATVREAAESAKAGQSTRIAVLGPSDTVGTVADKHDLTERRIEAVRALLIASGIPENDILVRHAAVPELDSSRPIEIVVQ
ncbi:MAG TPA: OmpA family protein, partial [Stellaceae bacterium]|nr:OmpA family protein [Stellaceae bacterium]